MRKSTRMTIWFFTGYILLMLSLISSVAFIDFNKATSPIKITEHTIKQEEIKVEEIKNKEPKQLLFNVSDEFAIIAITVAAIVDIFIVILWARKENQKLEGKDVPRKKRWRDTKLFWNIVAMGVIQPKNKKFSINWINMITVTVLLHVLLYLLLTKY